MINALYHFNCVATEKEHAFLQWSTSCSRRQVNRLLKILYGHKELSFDTISQEEARKFFDECSDKILMPYPNAFEELHSLLRQVSSSIVNELGVQIDEEVNFLNIPSRDEDLLKEKFRRRKANPSVSPSATPPSLSRSPRLSASHSPSRSATTSVPTNGSRGGILVDDDEMYSSRKSTTLKRLPKMFSTLSGTAYAATVSTLSIHVMATETALHRAVVDLEETLLLIEDSHKA